MKLRWRAVLVGALMAVTLSLILVSFLPDLPQIQGIVATFVPAGILAGVIAGYMSTDVRTGVIHGGLATLLPGLLWVALLVLTLLMFADGLPETTPRIVLQAVLILLAQVVPGVVAGAFGGWASSRDELREATATDAP